MTNPKFSRLCLGITRQVHGAGSTTSAKILSKILNLPFIEAGTKRREMAKDDHFSQNLYDDQGLYRFEKEKITKDPQIDFNLDVKLMKKITKKSCIFGGQNLVRLCKTAKIIKAPVSCLFFTVLLVCDKKVSAKRVLERKKREGLFKGKIDQKNLNQEIKDSEKRMQGNLKAWFKLYNLKEEDYFNPKAYDLVIDTTKLTQNQVASLILKNLVLFLLTSSATFSQPFSSSLFPAKVPGLEE